MISLTRSLWALAGADRAANPPARATAAAKGKINFVMSYDILSSAESGRGPTQVPSIRTAYSRFERPIATRHAVRTAAVSKG